MEIGVGAPVNFKSHSRVYSYFLEGRAKRSNDLIPCIGTDGLGRGDRSDCRGYFLSRKGEAAGCGEDGGCSLPRHSAHPFRTPNAQVAGIATLATKSMDMAQSLEVVGAVLLACLHGHPSRPVISKLAKFSWISTQKNGAKHTKEKSDFLKKLVRVRSMI